MTQSRFVIIDRDGVINVDSEAYVKSPEEWTPIARSLEAIALL
ncbi:MAG: D-glycero-beta-D-manno-heptose-1,7-bisphosphate 7-phosphatase, partial [Betaproteobacteria bacterium]|nr:D-glycero-beta-D-manno-heptose-1,7-bisphosphate 7-phosphatase [Betaproteobacteria bacterium]